MKIFLTIASMLLICTLQAQKKNVQKITAVKPKIDVTGLADGPIRFSTSNAVVFGGEGEMKFVQRYNTNPFSVIIGVNSIRIKKSGLYHFEGFVSTAVFGNNALGLPGLTYSLEIGTDSYKITDKKLIPLKDLTKTNSYLYSEKYSLDLYITAPSIIILKRDIQANFAIPSNIMTEGWFTGYLMSE
jgi:hypothetical protein